VELLSIGDRNVQRNRCAIARQTSVFSFGSAMVSFPRGVPGVARGPPVHASFPTIIHKAAIRVRPANRGARRKSPHQGNTDSPILVTRRTPDVYG